MICKWVDDSHHLILENFEAIQASPSKIYHEAVPFSPPSSWLHDCYSQEFLQSIRVIKGFQGGWGACSRTVLLDDTPCSLACWSNLIATGLESRGIIILDAITGTCLCTLTEHTSRVRSLVFSSDGSSLVSGNADKIVHLWDVQTGGVIRSFYGHTEVVSSVSISPDQTTIASGSADTTIHLWNAQTGECRHVIKAHTLSVRCVSFSPIDSQLLMSVSEDNIVQQWYINGHQIGPAYKGGTTAFSSDGAHFLSWGGGVATVWNSSSGVIFTKIQAPKGAFDCCCFSPNGKYVAGTSNYNIYIWDITSQDPHLIKTMVGHTRSIISMVFSSSLITTSYDQTIRLWQIDTSSTNLVAADSKSKPLASASVTFVSLQVKDHIAISSDEAGLVRTWDLSTGLCKATIKISAGPLTWRDAQLIDGRLLLVWRTSKRIYIWDTKEKKAKKVDRRTVSSIDLRISGDGSRVFLLGSHYIWALSTQTGEAVGEVEMRGKLSKNPFTVEGSRVWAHFESSETQGWDFGVPGPTPITSSYAPLASPHLEFIRSTTERSTIPRSRVKDTVSGKEILQLPWRYENFTTIQWDGQYLVAGYKSGELLILDFSQVMPR